MDFPDLEQNAFGREATLGISLRQSNGQRHA